MELLLDIKFGTEEGITYLFNDVISVLGITIFQNINPYFLSNSAVYRRYCDTLCEEIKLTCLQFHFPPGANENLTLPKLIY